jgi:hypothetical protein
MQRQELWQSTFRWTLRRPKGRSRPSLPWYGPRHTIGGITEDWPGPVDTTPVAAHAVEYEPLGMQLEYV